MWMKYIFKTLIIALIFISPLNSAENKSKLLENEIKKFGRTPKKTKVERGEYKDVYSSNGGNTLSS